MAIFTQKLSEVLLNRLQKIDDNNETKLLYKNHEHQDQFFASLLDLFFDEICNKNITKVQYKKDGMKSGDYIDFNMNWFNCAKTIRSNTVYRFWKIEVPIDSFFDEVKIILNKDI